jgi:hypothetical protein
MKQAYVFISILSIFFACTKVEKHDGLYIRGRLFLYDTITQSSSNVPLANKRVVLAQNNGDSLNYLYADTTDADGYFLFDLLNDGKDSFVVRYEEKVNTYQYKAFQAIAKGEKSVVLTARLDEATQNGFTGYIKDSLGGNMPGATLHVYNSIVLAEINNSSGAIETVTASNTGRVYKLNLPAGKYYLNASKQVDTIVFQRIAKEITLNKNGFLHIDSVRLLRKQ